MKSGERGARSAERRAEAEERRAESTERKLRQNRAETEAEIKAETRRQILKTQFGFLFSLSSRMYEPLLPNANVLPYEDLKEL